MIILLILAIFLLAALAPILAKVSSRFNFYVFGAAFTLAVAVFGFNYKDLAGKISENIFSIQFNWVIDEISYMITLVVLSLAAIINFYCSDYMIGKERIGQFSFSLQSFSVAMLGLILADDWITFFLFWELISLFSFSLIAYDQTIKSRKAALQTLTITGLGGLFLLPSFLIFQQLTGQQTISGFIEYTAILRESPYILISMILVIIAGFTKSAQFPFSFWLPNAMIAPTPISAFLHSATLVKAGVYLLARLSPIFSSLPIWYYVLPIIGLITLFVAVFRGIFANDLKIIFAQTTLAALGVLTIIASLMPSPQATYAFIVFFIAHAAYKSALFLATGTIEYTLGSRLLELIGKAKKFPLIILALLLAGASMIGIPFFLGYEAKHAIYEVFAYNEVVGFFVLSGLIIGNSMLMIIFINYCYKLIIPSIGTSLLTVKLVKKPTLILQAVPFLLSISGLLLPFWLIENNILNGRPLIDSSQKHNAIILPWLFSTLPWVLGLSGYIIKKAKFDQLVLTRQPIIEYFYHFVISTLDLISKNIRFWGRLQYQNHILFLIMVFFGILVGIAILPELTRINWEINWLELNYMITAIVGIIAILSVITLLQRHIISVIFTISIIGFGVCLLFVFFQAPDLAFTQFMIEILSIVTIVLTLRAFSSNFSLDW
ncbi:MAG: DUF4040 domain-containing protein, partial [Alphaproteobacteria bacterium]|nr:DUF4040 domain-containing protein [Alphaproteobacteria bacterium]